MIMTSSKLYGPPTTYRNGKRLTPAAPLPRQRQALRAANQDLRKPRPAAKLKTGRIVALAALIMITFLTGLTLGDLSGRAAADHKPGSDTLAILHYCQSTAKPGQICYAEWREASQDFEIVSH